MPVQGKLGWQRPEHAERPVWHWGGSSVLGADHYDQQLHHCNTGAWMQWSLHWRDIAPDAVQPSCSPTPGTAGAKRCRHQLPLPHAALTMLAPIFRLLLSPPPHGLSPWQALSPSVSKAGLFVPCTDSFFPSLTPSPATAQVAREQKLGLAGQQQTCFYHPCNVTIGLSCFKI